MTTIRRRREQFELRLSVPRAQRYAERKRGLRRLTVLSLNRYFNIEAYGNNQDVAEHPEGPTGVEDVRVIELEPLGHLHPAKHDSNVPAR